jgi:hypothetical protein
MVDDEKGLPSSHRNSGNSPPFLPVPDSPEHLSFRGGFA